MYKIIVFIFFLFLVTKQPLITKCNILEDKQLPWCKNWNNNKGQFKCYINKHLQRKCYWGCNR